MLVNDLDLRVIGPLDSTPTTYKPWILDPVNPGNAATKGDNTRDNVEVVEIAAPAAGFYKFQVTYKGSLCHEDYCHQEFSLILTGVTDPDGPLPDYAVNIGVLQVKE